MRNDTCRINYSFVFIQISVHLCYLFKLLGIDNKYSIMFFHNVLLAFVLLSRRSIQYLFIHWVLEVVVDCCELFLAWKENAKLQRTWLKSPSQLKRQRQAVQVSVSNKMQVKILGKVPKLSSFKTR